MSFRQRENLFLVGMDRYKFSKSWTTGRIISVMKKGIPTRTATACRTGDLLPIRNNPNGTNMREWTNYPNKSLETLYLFRKLVFSPWILLLALLKKPRISSTSRILSWICTPETMEMNILFNRNSIGTRCTYWMSVYSLEYADKRQQMNIPQKK